MTKPVVLAPISEILVAYWRSDRWMLLILAVVVLLSSVASVGAPYLFARLVDRLSQEGFVTTLTWGLVAYALLLGIALALRDTAMYLSITGGENISFIAGTSFFQRLLKKTATFFVEHNAAEIENANVRGQRALSELVGLGTGVLIPGAIQILLTWLTLGALINIEVAAVVVVYGVGAVTLTLIAVRRGQVFLDKAIEARQENARFLGNAMNAMETLRHFGSHGWMNRRFTVKAIEVRDSWRAYALQQVGYLSPRALGLTIQFAVTFLLLLPRYEAGTLTLGGIVLFNTLLLQLNRPFELIPIAINSVARSRADIVPLATMWAAAEEQEVSRAPAFVPREGRLMFENVTYAYGNGRGVKDIGFTAERGAITFLVGETGSGKSTIFRLALKSIEPDQGRILVDEVDLATVARTDWYAAVAVVPQDVVLLNETLADNILLGRPRDEKRLRQAAEKAAILPFIEALPEVFETVVGERGLKLSGGERQRIAIARALYGNPLILFLDEASSALDEATERDIMEHIRMLCRDVTVLAITHRRTVLAPTDRIVDLGALRLATRL
jgi:ATP-binding cassette, subfamily B, bacterial